MKTIFVVDDNDKVTDKFASVKTGSKAEVS